MRISEALFVPRPKARGMEIIMANNEMRYCEFCERETLFFLSDDWRCGECGSYFDSEEDSKGNRCPYCGEDLEKEYDTVCPYCGEELDEDYETVHEKEYNTVMEIISDKYDYPTVRNEMDSLEISLEEFSEEEIIKLCRYASEKKNGTIFFVMGEYHEEVISTYIKSLSDKEKMEMACFSLACLEAIYEYDSIDSTEFYSYIARLAGGPPERIGDGSIYKTILKKSPGFREWKYLGNVLIHAAQNNDRTTAEFAMKNLWDVPKDKYQGLIDEALTRSACSGSLEMINYMLMQKGAAAEHVKEKMFLRASMLGKLDVIKYLIDLGLAIQPYINKMLGQAVKFGNSDLTFYLLNEYDTPEAPIDMESVLQQAISFHQPDIALRLVLSGVNKDNMKSVFYESYDCPQYMGEDMLDDFIDSFSNSRRISYINSMKKDNLNEFVNSFSASGRRSHSYFYGDNPVEDFLCGLLTGDKYDMNIALIAAFFKREKHTYDFLLNQIPKEYGHVFSTFDVMTECYYKDWSCSGLYGFNNCFLCYSSDFSFDMDSGLGYWKCGDCGARIRCDE